MVEPSGHRKLNLISYPYVGSAGIEDLLAYLSASNSSNLLLSLLSSYSLLYCSSLSFCA